MTYMLLLNCALKLVGEIILYYDARSKKHQINSHCNLRINYVFCSYVFVLSQSLYNASLCLP